MIAGKQAFKPGEAKNSWLTGAAAWTFVAASQHILGIRPEFDGLHVDPCIPKQWKEVTVTRRFRNSIYHITIKNPKGRNRGVSEMTLDGTRMSGNVLPVLNDHKQHDVEVTIL
jgi:cellobiose phosphorylase